MIIKNEKVEVKKGVKASMPSSPAMLQNYDRHTQMHSPELKRNVKMKRTSIQLPIPRGILPSPHEIIKSFFLFVGSCFVIPCCLALPAKGEGKLSDGVASRG